MPAIARSPCSIRGAPRSGSRSLWRLRKARAAQSSWCRSHLPGTEHSLAGYTRRVHPASQNGGGWGAEAWRGARFSSVIRSPISTDVTPSKTFEYCFLRRQPWVDAFPPPLAPHYARLCTFLNTILAAWEPTPLCGSGICRPHAANVDDWNLCGSDRNNRARGVSPRVTTFFRAHAEPAKLRGAVPLPPTSALSAWSLRDRRISLLPPLVPRSPAA